MVLEGKEGGCYRVAKEIEEMSLFYARALYRPINFMIRYLSLTILRSLYNPPIKAQYYVFSLALIS